jgi:hypothetical protein
MSDFVARRIAHEYTQTNCAPPQKVFPLLCPVRETEWIPGWKYRMIYSQSGVAEADCVFTTPDAAGSETTWVVTDYDPAQFRIGFVWMRPGMVVCRMAIQLEEAAQGTTRTLIHYTYTGLSPAGNEEVERYNTQWFRHKMAAWETAINQYLKTGKLISAPVSK